MLRLSEHVPPVFEGGPEFQKYEKIVFDFRYLKQTDLLEGIIEENTEACLHPSLLLIFISFFFISSLIFTLYLHISHDGYLICELSLSLSTLLSLSPHTRTLSYLHSPPQLLDMDHDFKENNFEILHRFYLLFESVWKYVQDINRYFLEVEEGYYIQVTLDMVLACADGKQLVSEVRVCVCMCVCPRCV